MRNTIIHTTVMGAVLATTGCSLIYGTDGFLGADGGQGTDAGVDAGDARDSGDRRDVGPACEPGFIECDEGCVDLETSPEHCGACSNACPARDGAVATCAAGECSFECAGGRTDCNHEPGDGCEVDTATDVLHCGGCGLACEAALACREGSCRPRLVWARGFGGPGEDVINGIALDGAGNVYVVGHFSGSVNFGGEPLSSAFGGMDVFVASYTAEGVHRWSLRVGADGDDLGNAIATDTSGNVYVTGSFAGVANFGGSDLTAEGADDLFIASYTSTGAHRWSVSAGGTGIEFARGIAVDPSGTVYVTGMFQGAARFARTGMLTSAGDLDIFIAAYTSSGDAEWSRRIGSTAFDQAFGIAADVAGNVFVTGFLEGTWTLGTSTVGPGWFTTSFTSAGTHRWSNEVGGSGVAADASGNIYVAGTFTHSISLGDDTLLGAGGADALLVSLTSDGDPRWLIGGGGPGTDVGTGIAIDNVGNVHMIGYFAATANFGGGPLASAGPDDIFMASYAMADGIHQSSLRFDGYAVDYWTIATSLRTVCAAGSFWEPAVIGDETFVSAGGPDGLIVCVEQ